MDEFASVVCSIPIKVFGVARLARSDLLRVVNYIVTKVSTWASTCEITSVNRLAGHVLNTKCMFMMGRVGGAYPRLLMVLVVMLTVWQICVANSDHNFR